MGINYLDTLQVINVKGTHITKYRFDFMSYWRSRYNELLNRYYDLYDRFNYINNRLNYINETIDNSAPVLIATYNVTTTTSNTKLCNVSQSNIDVMEIDGTPLQSPVNTYKFNSTGIHTVKFTLKLGTTSITNSVFYNCSNLTSIKISSKITSIGNSVFYNCTGLNTPIAIPESVTSIGSSVFKNCSNIQTINLGSSLVTIGDEAFRGCTSLKSINIPQKVTSIGSLVFTNCISLESMKVNSNNTTYDSRNNCNAIIKKSNNELIYGCKNTKIPNTVISIGSNAFRDCTSLTSITFPNSVTTINNSAFYGCSGLTSIIIPDSIGTISNYAFYNCYGLTSVKIGDGVSSIGTYAFYRCTNLLKVIIGNTIYSKISSIGSYAFYNCSNLKIIRIRKGSHSNPVSIPSIQNNTFYGVAENGILYISYNIAQYDTNWLKTDDYYLGKYNWTIVYGDVQASVNVNDKNNGYKLINENLSDLESIQIDDNFYDTIPSNFKNYKFNSTGLHRISYIFKDSGDGISSSNPYKICKSAFENCSIETVQFSPLIEGIGKSAFSGCNKLRDIDFGLSDNVLSITDIGDRAFYNCTSLQELYIMNPIASIGDFAFYGCISMTRLSISRSVTAIGTRAFTDCYSLSSIAVASDNQNYDSRNSCKAIIHTESNTLLFGCKNTSIPNTVTSIADYAFFHCVDLQSISIPDSVISIGNWAFYGCARSYGQYEGNYVPIDDYDPGASSQFLQNCENLEISGSFTGLTSINLPTTLQSIGVGAFMNCPAITGNLYIFSSIRSIGHHAFANCININFVIFYSNSVLESINEKTFFRCINIHPSSLPLQLNNLSNLKYIREKAFYQCRSIYHVDFPNSLQSIGDAAFYDCQKLNNVDFKNVQSIGSYSFASIYTTDAWENYNGGYEKRFTDIYIPASLTSIGDQAFWDCRNIKNIFVESANPNYESGGNQYQAIIQKNGKVLLVGYRDTVIPNDVQKIAKCAFYHRTTPSNIELPNSVTCIEEQAFCESTGLQSITIPNSVLGNIRFATFKSCHELISVEIGNNIREIEQWAFNDCHHLVNITIGNSVTKIGEEAFQKCESITQIVFPNTLNEIGCGSFYQCKNLNKITCLGNIAPHIVQSNYEFWGRYNYATFKDVSENGELIVPNNSNGYQNWLYYKEYTLGYYRWICPQYDCVRTTYYSDNGEYLHTDKRIKYIIIDGIELNLNELSDYFWDVGDADAHYGFNINGGMHSIQYGLWDIASINKYLFSNHTSLYSVDLPNYLTSIGTEAFMGCQNLRSIYIPNLVTKINDRVFKDCTNLETLTLGNSVSQIGSEILSNCNDLTRIISRPETAPSIKSDTFKDIPLYVTLNIPINNNNYDIWLQNSAYYLGYSHTNVSNYYKLIATYKNITAGSSVKLSNMDLSIFSSMMVDGIKINKTNEYTFNTSGDHTVTWIFEDPSNNLIPYNAFQNIGNLYSVIIPYSVVSIGDQAFSNCSILKTITLPNSMVSIGNYVFKQSYQLNEIICQRYFAPSLNAYSFNNMVSVGDLYVPTSAIGYDNWLSKLGNWSLHFT